MLSSDTIAPPKSINRSAATASIHSSSSVPDEERETPDPEPTTTSKTNEPAYADSQGDLPEDAIKVDSVTEANNDDRKEESSSSGVSNDSGDQVASSTDQVAEVASDEGSDKQEKDTGQENDKSEGNNGEGKVEGEQDTGTEDKKVHDAQESEESTQNPEQESKETKENGQSEDSGGTEKPGDDRGTNPPQSVVEETNGEDSGGNHSQQSTTDNDQIEEEGPKENSDHVISNEDQQKRLEQHHKQEDQMQRAEQPQNETRDNEENQKVANKDIDYQKEKASKPVVKDSLPAGDDSGIPKESKDSKKSWATQADQSENEKERRNVGTSRDKNAHTYGYEWQLCNVTASADYIPCLDNEKAIAKLRSRRHYEHRERHCPEEAPSCLVQLPDGYKKPIEWPHSRKKIWYNNVPHKLLAEVKGHQNWVKVTGEFLTFPGGGTQFIRGALHYIDFIMEVRTMQTHESHLKKK